MSYDSMVEQIKSVPQECLEEIGNYIQFVFYRYTLTVKANQEKNLSKYFDSVNFRFSHSLFISIQFFKTLDFFLYHFYKFRRI